MNRLLAPLVLLVAVALGLAVPLGAIGAETSSTVPAGGVDVVTVSAMPSAADLDAYLIGKGSPMAGQGGAFLASGGRWQLDPRLLVAIAGAESNFGAITCAPFNAWGWGCPNGPYDFDSWADGIDTVAEGLRTNYLSEGRTTVALINLKYAPVGAENDPTGLNNHWTTNVSRFLTELGGDPGNVDIAGIAGSRPLGLAPGIGGVGEYQFTEAAPTDAAATEEAGLLEVSAGAPRPLVVVVQNTGSVPWNAATVQLRRVDVEARVVGAPYGALAGSDGNVEPGGKGRFIVQLAARGAVGGTATTQWRLEGPGGAFGSEITREVKFDVPPFVAGQSRIDYTPANSGIIAGESAWTVVVHVQNDGSAPWVRDGDAGVLLGLVEGTPLSLTGEGWVNAQVPARMLEREVRPGEEASFAFRVRGDAGTATLRPFHGDGWATGSTIVVDLADAPR
ncbi:MAG: conjugal transfer protein [Thermoleophilia bacterium]|nr:conjugal transfer protein [Thermoleophilia bacterium]